MPAADTVGTGSDVSGIEAHMASTRCGATFTPVAEQLGRDSPVRRCAIAPPSPAHDSWGHARERTHPGLGLLTATALVAAVGGAGEFRSGRDVAAWLGPVPRQHTTGGKQTLPGIGKHGNKKCVRFIFLRSPGDQGKRKRLGVPLASPLSLGSTGSLSSASTPKTHSCTRYSGSRSTKRCRASCPSMNSRRASARLGASPRWRRRSRFGASV